MRIKGWMGRADQTTKVKGMFVHPSQVARGRANATPRSCKARLVVDHDADKNDRMTLRCEVDGTPTPTLLAQAIDDTLREVSKLRGEVEFSRAGALPNDGKVIEDLRKYD